MRRLRGDILYTIELLSYCYKTRLAPAQYLNNHEI
jgi:hypothetical protein